MNSVPIKKLITEKISGEWGTEPSDTLNGGVAVIRTANFLNTGKIDFSKIVQREIDPKKVSKKKLMSGDIIIEKSGGSPTQPVGRVVLFDNPDGEVYLCNNFTSILRPDREVVHPEYLFYALFDNHLKGKTLRYQNKTTGIINLKLDNYLNSEIPLPALDDQKRIAHLLGKVEGLIARRKQHLQQLDDLLKSVFLEMFGFRDQTYTKWSVDKLAIHTEVVSGVTKGKKYKTEDLIEIPYMRVANVQDGHFVLDEIKTILVTQKEIDQYQLQSGDLLLTEGGDPDKLGRGSVWESQIERCIHQNHIFRVRINDLTELNPYYLSALIGSRYGKSYFLKSAKQTTGIASINSTQLKNFPVVIPPTDLQNQFAAIVEKVEGLKSRYQQSLTDLESLYGALSQKAFKGELDLSRVVLTTEVTESTEATNHERHEKHESKTGVAV